jgi:hypothetical protein
MGIETREKRACGREGVGAVKRAREKGSRRKLKKLAVQYLLDKIRIVNF